MPSRVLSYGISGDGFGEFSGTPTKKITKAYAFAGVIILGFLHLSKYRIYPGTDVIDGFSKYLKTTRSHAHSTTLKISREAVEQEKIFRSNDPQYNFRMVYEIVRITVDLYAPGAVISQRYSDWMMDWDHFHTNRIVYPVRPANLLLECNDQGCAARTDFAHVRLTPIGTSYTGIVNGVTDHLLTTTRLDFLLGNELFRMVQKALVLSRPCKHGKTQATWLEIWEVEEETPSVKFFADLNLDELVEAIKKTAE